MVYNSNAVVVSRAEVLTAATVNKKKNIPALKFIVGGAALAAARGGIEPTLAGEGGAIFLSVCLLAGALVALLGIIRLFPR